MSSARPTALSIANLLHGDQTITVPNPKHRVPPFRGRKDSASLPLAQTGMVDLRLPLGERDYALPWQHRYALVDAVEAACSWMPVILVDAQVYDRDQDDASGDRRPLPDVCLTYNKFRPPVLDKLSSYFVKHGLIVGSNYPLAGSILPARYVENPSVTSIGIAIHRDLLRRDIESISCLSKNIDGAVSVLQRAVIEGAA